MKKQQKDFWSWCLYDFAISGFTSVVQTFLFSSFFVSTIAENKIAGSVQWGRMVAFVGLAVGITAPLLGAFADREGRRRDALIVFTLLCSLLTFLLGFVDSAPRALFTAGLAIFAAEMAFIFYNSLLVSMVSEAERQRWSSAGWGLGFAGGLLCLFGALFFLYWTSSVYVTFSFTGIWILFFSLPLLRNVPSPGAAALPGNSLKELYETLKTVCREKRMLWFLLSRLFWADALSTLFAFAGIFAAVEFGFSPDKILLYAIVLHVAAMIGCLIPYWAGGIPTISSLYWSIGILLTSLLVFSITTDEELFWIASGVTAACVGPLQATARTLFAMMAEPEKRCQFFGLYALFGKATSFLGPLLVAFTIELSTSHRLAMGPILLFLAIGWTLLAVSNRQSSKAL